MLEPPVTPIRKANDGLELPATGFGTYKVNGLAGVDAIKSAIHQATDSSIPPSTMRMKRGGPRYPRIRCAARRHHRHVQAARRHHAHDEALLTIEESVCRMGLDYIDLYLIHWPNPSQGQFVEAWEALVEARERGLVKHIGVSNFLPGHIDLLIRDTGVTPAVNQVELHPYFQQREQLAYDNAHGIITEAWSPLGRANQMLRDPDLKRIAAKHGISVVQAILRWHLQYGDVAIPKSLNPERQRQNLDLTAFELDDQDMADIAAMDNPEGHTFGQNPHWHEEA